MHSRYWVEDPSIDIADLPPDEVDDLELAESLAPGLGEEELAHCDEFLDFVDHGHKAAR